MALGVAPRFYDPATGQFTSRDPLNAVTRSAYGYVYGNPLNASDPTGLMCWNPTDMDCLGHLVDDVVPDDMSTVGDVVEPMANTLTGVNQVGMAIALAGGADCGLRDGRILCTGGFMNRPGIRGGSIPWK